MGHATPPPRAVVFDVDGTLYRQPPLRRRMALELLAAAASRPLPTLRAIRIVGRFRAEREALRALGRPERPLDELQYESPARRLGVDPEAVRTIVHEWIHRRPLRHLASCRRPDLVAALDRLADLGVPVAVFSDYPAEAKLSALGLEGRAAFALSATEPPVNAFKPHPAGFLEAARRLGLAPHQVLYVGDRAEVDLDGAIAAGLRARLVGSSRHAAPSFAAILDEQRLS